MGVRLWSVVALLVGMLTVSSSAGAFEEEKEESIPLDKLPKAVVESIKKMFPDAEMKLATKEVVKDEDDDDDDAKTETDKKDADDKDADHKDEKDDDEKDTGEKDEGDSEVIYEVTLSEKGKTIDVTVDEEGDIEEVERSIELKELPRLVADALARKFPKSTLKSAEAIYEVEDGEMEFEGYEVILETADKKEIEADVEVEIHIEVGEE